MQAFCEKGMRADVGAFLAGQAPQVEKGAANTRPVVPFSKNREALFVNATGRRHVSLRSGDISLVVQRPRHPGAVAKGLEACKSFLVQGPGARVFALRFGDIGEVAENASRGRGLAQILPSAKGICTGFLCGAVIPQ